MCQLWDYDRPFDSNRKASPSRSALHEADLVAPENHWKIPESLEKVILFPRSLHPHLKWWLQEADVLHGQPLYPLSHALQIYRCLKRRLGCSLRRSHGKRDLVPARKQVAYALPETKRGLCGPKRVPRPLFKQDYTHSNRQHHSCCNINKEVGIRSGHLPNGQERPSQLTLHSSH